MTLLWRFSWAVTVGAILLAVDNPYLYWFAADLFVSWVSMKLAIAFVKGAE
jgi:hypothetical protein